MNRALICALTLAFVAGGCDAFTGPRGHLSLSVHVSSDVVHADSGVTIRAEARNTSGQDLTLETIGGCVVGFRVVAPSDSTVLRIPGGCALILKHVTVPAGEAVITEYRVERFFS